ncbi:hypothetical protein NWP22_07370 [Anabaenopsis tanganyikae CS-531]|uniref:Uncharacterized protein n=2 Tax=Anabaenopsis TaxID=110103 RepID=A0ABT6KCU5_9CYAN|nr:MULTISPECIES: hypothetical protein [Anabaenopsis]MDB9539114.1 hypothetical protein [Anabaenopsis arnoldii]MDH6091402.1 hypothetical protein [Anabaenopsis arnoldii]MDH6105686.1 hypothetical protein [Anabaenopsis tanganyikae CS-531]
MGVTFTGVAYTDVSTSNLAHNISLTLNPIMQKIFGDRQISVNDTECSAIVVS